MELRDCLADRLESVRDMQMTRWVPLCLLLIGGGCGTSPGGVEATREIVLQYVGRDVGTVGPFSKQAKRELGALSKPDREKALALMDGGAAGFLIIERDPALANRMVLVAKGKVVGDFPAAKDEPGR